MQMDAIAEQPASVTAVQGEFLLEALGRLCSEVGRAPLGPEVRLNAQARRAANPSLPALSPADEQLVAELTAELGRLADLPAAEATDAPAMVAWAALDGAEYVTRTEISKGNASRLPELLPDLAYFVV